ncbi:dihydrofolate reductase [Deinococcus sp. KSM4-11]|uniref:dihydrofolate reductase family protein n=1 Tax=Deinococcus sp. KSM4-11 TaxID=2568654 RepID=UPI0010A39D61|nr:dihydrofolate reductase family protein [Deinococcus sp. KSM4-11]THF83937.1 dihydrofolate reductase [Deinococcus sp. KSM4-11]
MRKVIAAEYLSLDGIMSDPSWSAPYFNDELARSQRDLLFQSDLLLQGRVTYDGMSRAWMQASDEQGFAERMNALPKRIATRSAQELTWNATAIQGDVPAEVERLRQEDGGHILIYGSGQLVRSLMPHSLIDEFRLIVCPVVLGSGQRLFAEGVQATLTLTDVTTTSTGVALMTYRPA